MKQGRERSLFLTSSLMEAASMLPSIAKPVMEAVAPARARDLLLCSQPLCGAPSSHPTNFTPTSHDMKH